MKQKFTASVWQQGDWFVAYCLDAEVGSQGETGQIALDNRRKALEARFGSPLTAVIKKKGFDAVAMKRFGAEKIHEIIKDLTLEEELAYWQERTQDLLSQQQAAKERQENQPK